MREGEDQRQRHSARVGDKLARYARLESGNLDHGLRPDEIAHDVLGLLKEVAELRKALVAVSDFQSQALAVFRKHGIKFEDLGTDPKNWQHVAFSVYSDLCEVATIATAALDDA